MSILTILPESDSWESLFTTKFKLLGNFDLLTSNRPSELLWIRILNNKFTARNYSEKQ